MAFPTTFPTRTLLTAVLVGSSTIASAQNPPAPRVLRIGQEMVKPAMGGAHAKHEAGWPAAFANAGVDINYIALSNTTGAGDMLYISGYPSFAALEAENDIVGKAPGLAARLDALSAKDAEYLTAARTLIAPWNEAMSIGTPPDWSKVRGYRITMVRVKIGHTGDYEKARAMQKESWAKAGIDPHIGVYRVTEGVNTPTYMIFRPFGKMAEFDEYGAINEKLMAAGTTPESRAEVGKLTESSVLTSEVNTYVISTSQSLPTRQTAEAAPEFWKGNPVLARGKVTQAGKPKP